MSAVSVSDISKFWESVRFFGSTPEERMAKYWYCLFIPPAIVLIFWGMWFDQVNAVPHSLKNILAIGSDPFIESLGVALFMSGIAFQLWQAKIRDTFSTCIESGIIASDLASIKTFAESSMDFQAQTSSRLRFIPIASMVSFAIITNRLQFTFSVAAINDHRPLEALYRILMVLCFAMFGYAIGAVVWSQITAALWIASLSTKKILRIQPGHSDECCGLQDIGTCCLQSAVPLLIGMALCLVWTNSYHWKFFTSLYSPDDSLMVQLQQVSNILIVIFFMLACALVFLPVRDLHKRLKANKRQQEICFTSAIENELMLLSATLATNDTVLIKTAWDRMNLVKSMDTTVLKLATWPFDRTSLIKYGVTPILSLAASFGKDAVKALGIG